MGPKFEDFDFPDSLELHLVQLRTCKMNKHLIKKKMIEIRISVRFSGHFSAEKQHCLD